MRIFIGYGGRPAETVADLLFEYFYPSQKYELFIFSKKHNPLAAGLKYKAYTRKAIHQADVIVMVCTRETEDSANAKEEAGWAISEAVPIIQFIENDSPAPSFIGTDYVYIRFNFLEPELKYQELEDNFSKLKNFGTILYTTVAGGAQAP